MDALTQDLKSLALAEGADLIGVAPVDRFQEAPRMTHPQAILPDAKAVVVISVKYPDAAIDGWGTISCGRCLHSCGAHKNRTLAS